MDISSRPISESKALPVTTAQFSRSHNRLYLYLKASIDTDLYIPTKSTQETMAPTNYFCKRIVPAVNGSFVFPGAHYVFQPEGQENYAVLELASKQDLTFTVTDAFIAQLLVLAEKGMGHGRAPKQCGDMEVIQGVECIFMSRAYCNVSRLLLYLLRRKIQLTGDLDTDLEWPSSTLSSGPISL